MSNTPDNGGPAFPCAIYNGEIDAYEDEHGMTMRDYFAAKALAALIGHESKDYMNRGGKAVPSLATWAYEYADAMLRARKT